MIIEDQWELFHNFQNYYCLIETWLVGRMTLWDWNKEVILEVFRWNKEALASVSVSELYAGKSDAMESCLGKFGIGFVVPFLIQLPGSELLLAKNSLTKNIKI